VQQNRSNFKRHLSDYFVLSI